MNKGTIKLGYDDKGELKYAPLSNLFYRGQCEEDEYKKRFRSFVNSFKEDKYTKFLHIDSMGRDEDVPFDMNMSEEQVRIHFDNHRTSTEKVTDATKQMIKKFNQELTKRLEGTTSNTFRYILVIDDITKTLYCSHEANNEIDITKKLHEITNTINDHPELNMFVVMGTNEDYIHNACDVLDSCNFNFLAYISERENLEYKNSDLSLCLEYLYDIEEEGVDVNGFLYQEDVINNKLITYKNFKV